jgi:hypothetical protein
VRFVTFVVNKVDLALDARAELGEGPLWDDRRQRLLFVDIMRGHVHEFDPATGSDRVIDVGRPVGAVARRPRRPIIAAQDGFHRLDPATDGCRSAPVESNQPDTRMNDGAVDPPVASGRHHGHGDTRGPAPSTARPGWVGARDARARLDLERHRLESGWAAYVLRGHADPPG